MHHVPLRIPQAALLLLLGGCLAACDEQDQATQTKANVTRTEKEDPAAVRQKPAKTAAKAALPDDLPEGLLLAYAQFEVGPDGKVLPKPGPARLEMLYRRGGKWHTEALEDPDSNVFHKAFVYTPPDGAPGLLTLGGSDAAVKLWRRGAGGWAAHTLWKEDFGGKFNRMRDAEVGDLYGDGKPDIAVGTHDQGVVVVLRPEVGGKYRVERLHKEKDTFIHEIEIGDLNADGTPEVYATPSDPNRLDGKAQAGNVIRFVPAAKGTAGKRAEVVAKLGKRHAKEIFVGDVDEDGTDELYVAVEALTEGENPNVRIVEPVEIRRYDRDTPPDQGRVVASIEDRFCRFLTTGDLNGDGKQEMVAAAYRSGLWLLEPQADAKAPWKVTSIDRSSSGFEHAALITDLDGDGTDELYVASDDQGELRRYTWVNGKPRREVIHRREVPGAMLTWNLMPAPRGLLAPPVPGS